MIHQRPIRTYELLKAFNETAEAQDIYINAFLALVRKDYATWVKLRRRYALGVAKFIRGM